MTGCLRAHQIRLQDGELVLRPMTEEDWALLLAWNNDPEVLYFSDGDDVSGRSLDEVQRIYRSVARTALTFVIEVDGRPIGEGWVQEMNLPRVLARHPGEDLRRVDLAIGEKALWGHGYGTRAIRLLTRLAFEQGADAVFAVDVADYNVRSRRAFERVGYRVDGVVDVPQPAKGRHVYDLVRRRSDPPPAG
jgi:RimJ/RimL family protein N-acetyltransferase